MHTRGQSDALPCSDVLRHAIRVINLREIVTAEFAVGFQYHAKVIPTGIPRGRFTSIRINSSTIKR